MEHKSSKKCFSFYLILLLMCLFSYPLQTNTVVIEDYEDDYFSNQRLLSALFEKLYELENNNQGKVNIVHVGDSHIQGDYFTGTIRASLQNKFGNGGYGFTFPYSLSGSVGSRSVRYKSNVKWESLFNISPVSDVGVGLSGIALYTPHTDMMVELSVDDKYSFNKVKVIYPSEESPFKFSLSNNLSIGTAIKLKVDEVQNIDIHQIKRGETLSSIARKYKTTVKQLKSLNGLTSENIQAGKALKVATQGNSEIEIPLSNKANEISAAKLVNETRPYFSTFRCDTLLNKVMLLSERRKAMYNLNGFVLENDKPGLIYHSIGVNGAKISDYNKYPLFFKQLPILEPDLVILSFGTNESYGKLSTENYLRHLKRMIQNIEKENPKATVLVMTPPPSMFRRNRINPYISDYSLALVGLSNVPVWDLYSRMGGIESIKDKDGEFSELIARDKVHYKIKGYELQGNMFLSDFMNAYEKYKRNTQN